MIRLIEEISMNAWPAAETLLVDGWVLRFSGGYTRRANSVYPLYPSHLALEEKIRVCEDVYRSKGLPVIYKLTGASQPSGLDEHLAGLGYESAAHTSVQRLNLENWEMTSAGCELSDQTSEEWERAFARLSGIAEGSQAAHRQILHSILPPTGYAAIRAGDQVIGCGLGVCQAGLVGMFDIVIDPAFRRQGYGERLMRDLLSWGKRQGAHSAYLQVMLNNPPALRLYEKLGFREEYSYWYRVKN